MTTYELVDQEAWVTQFKCDGFTTVAGAVRNKRAAGDSIVAVEDGVVRALSNTEQMEERETVTQLMLR